ncbi:hypothetical protein EDD18DRAFT_1208655 [Armillaria luteobubalina]|nr:hypothetical protein EDD18DRAFT_1208655 [Armillaria luteobubalina]
MLYPDGAHITNLKQVRELCHEMQRPGIAPKVSGRIFVGTKVLALLKLVYPHAWQEKDLMLFIIAVFCILWTRSSMSLPPV